MTVKRLALLLPIFLLFGFVLPVSATVYVSNDHDWRTAYLLGYYASETGNYFFPLVDPNDAVPYVSILSNFIKTHPNEEVVIYEGSDPVIKNFESLLRTKGIKVRTVRFTDSLDLMFDLPSQLGYSPKGILFVPDGVGAWLLASAPYAARNDLAIYLINNRVMDRLVTLRANKVVIVGYNGKRLKEAFPNATIFATGNKYKDSVEIAKTFGSVPQVYVMSGLFLYLPAAPTKSPVYVNGGKYPILISKFDDFPEPVKDYILNTPSIKVVAFVGPDLINLWANAKSKYADSGKKFIILMSVKYPNVEGKNPSADYNPPYIILPSGEIALSVDNVRVLPNKVFLTIRNRGTGTGYFIITDLSLDCEGVKTSTSLTDPVFIGGSETVSVSLDLNQTIPSGRQCKVKVTGFYGPDKDRLELPFEKNLLVLSENIPDDPTKIEFLEAKYWPNLERVVVLLKNDSKTMAYAQVAADLVVDGVERTYRSNIVRVPPGKTAKAYIKVFLTDADILDNQDALIEVFYGKDADLLHKLLKVRTAIEKATFTDMVIAFVQENTLLVGGIVALLIIILLILRRR